MRGSNTFATDSTVPTDKLLQLFKKKIDFRLYDSIVHLSQMTLMPSFPVVSLSFLNPTPSTCPEYSLNTLPHLS